MRFYEQVMGVYFDDLDPFGILHNARYILLFERTLGSFWQQLRIDDLDDRWHLVRANHIEYQAPVKGPQNVRVRLNVERLGRTSLTFGFVIMPLDRDDAFAIGNRTVVRVDRKSFSAEPWTDEFRERLAEWLD
jgi:acyl-CoA thioester hydrolase